MTSKKKTKEGPARTVVRKADQLIATLRSAAEGRDFERRLREKCREVGLPVPLFTPYGSGEQVFVACKSRDQAIFALDFAKEVLTEMPE